MQTVAFPLWKHFRILPYPNVVLKQHTAGTWSISVKRCWGLKLSPVYQAGMWGSETTHSPKRAFSPMRMTPFKGPIPKLSSPPTSLAQTSVHWQRRQICWLSLNSGQMILLSSVFSYPFMFWDHGIWRAVFSHTIWPIDCIPPRRLFPLCKEASPVDTGWGAGVLLSNCPLPLERLPLKHPTSSINAVF